jgi:HD superfamily phosphohydrolase
MLTVHNGELMVEEKGIYSIEKFLVARRQMYWQVYLHKTVLSAEKMLVNLLQRVRDLIAQGVTNLTVGGPVDFFLYNFDGVMSLETLDKFCQLDDVELSFAVKRWSQHEDIVLRELCNRLLNRQLLKIKIQSEPFEAAFIAQKLQAASDFYKIDITAASYFVFTGEADNTMYKTTDERINILFKDGTVKDITAIDDPLINQTISAPIKKYYVCYL